MISDGTVESALSLILHGISFRTRKEQQQSEDVKMTRRLKTPASREREEGKKKKRKKKTFSSIHLDKLRFSAGEAFKDRQKPCKNGFCTCL